MRDLVLKDSDATLDTKLIEALHGLSLTVAGVGASRRICTNLRRQELPQISSLSAANEL